MLTITNAGIHKDNIRNDLHGMRINYVGSKLKRHEETTTKTWKLARFWKSLQSALGRNLELSWNKEKWQNGSGSTWGWCLWHSWLGQWILWIQCKGKDDYTKSELKESEVDEEIEKAKKFKPTLKKFYFATTANKDAKIEEYIRLKDEESRKNNGFEIHLFSWEDIVDLIDENKRTHDWYVNNIGFKTKYDINIAFSNGESTLEFSPLLIKNHITYKVIEKDRKGGLRIGMGVPHLSPDYNREERLVKLFEPEPVRYFMNGQTFNKSSCVFALLIENSGNIQVENYKMYINFKSETINVDTVSKQRQFLDSFKYTYNTFMYRDSNNCVFEPPEQILVQTDRITTDKICLRPTVEEPQEIILKYEFVAKDFNK